MKTKLSVNVNKIATLRNSRGGNTPNVVYFALKALEYGADGITVHPRPDGRHIRHQDVRDLATLLLKWPKCEFNIEGFPEHNYMNLIEEVRPHQATLVPDPPEALTSNAGWKLSENLLFLKNTVTQLRSLNVKSSLFIDVFEWSKAEADALIEIQPDRVELYTEAYAKDPRLISQYKKVAAEINKFNIGINAGHDLSTENLQLLLKEIPYIREVSIGHQLVSDALNWGWQKTIQTYLEALKSS